MGKYTHTQYLEVARSKTNDTLEIDDAVGISLDKEDDFSQSDDGCWVRAWIYVGDHEVKHHFGLEDDNNASG